ncbi:DUF6069 family protein [Herbiconiux moechotypicola]|uniref:Uncharacterized protein n=1 Tax=Herbiconiux moechotypicola TaxID=637393 RepID=A0ABN3DXA7_9MICO|nr:DUF6069 family protein [Herbiconiux moechotypicola]MCS5730797.1 DUF6069 family protein [Herbiconiux moechotypicola]
MTSSVLTETTASRSRLRTVLILAAAVVAAVAVNTLISAVAAASGAPSDYGPLTFPAFTLFTVIGVVVGWVGWSLVQRRARHPRRVLTVLVPVVVVLSLVPNVLLLAIGFIPGTTVAGVVALMLMHVVVAAVAVPAYALASRGAARSSA